MNKKAAKLLSRYLAEYGDEQGVYMKINFVNPDHVHALIDLPTGLSVEKAVQLLKGSSSHWVNSNDVITGKFAWGRGYGLPRRRAALLLRIALLHGLFGPHLLQFTHVFCFHVLRMP